MKVKSILKMALGGIFCLVFLTYGTAVRAADPIPIGVMGPFTGSIAFNAEEMKKGMLLAVDEVNAKGGIFGRKLELIFGDSEQT
jgi:branched-chain amino acid transport system substrate-binding protein